MVPLGSLKYISCAPPPHRQLQAAGPAARAVQDEGGPSRGGRSLAISTGKFRERRCFLWNSRTCHYNFYFQNSTSEFKFKGAWDSTTTKGVGGLVSSGMYSDKGTVAATQSSAITPQ